MITLPILRETMSLMPRVRHSPYTYDVCLEGAMPDEQMLINLVGEPVEDLKKPHRTPPRPPTGPRCHKCGGVDTLVEQVWQGGAMVR